MASTSRCVICDNSLSSGETVYVVKGLTNLLDVSKRREDGKHTHFENVGIELHKVCRREYIKERNIAQYIKEKKTKVKPVSQVLRSQEIFDFKTNCLLCGGKCDVGLEKKKPLNKRRKVFEIRSLSVRGTLLQKAALRNDAWGQQVASRIERSICLVAEEGRYHQDCYSKFSSNPPSCKKRGRSEDENFASAFEELRNYIEESDECQFSLIDLMRIIDQHLPSNISMTLPTLRQKLIEEFGDGVVFATMKKKPTIVCFRGPAHNRILNSWYSDRASNDEEERKRIVKIAATIIREDIRSVSYNTTEYPKLLDFIDEADTMVPDTLNTFLKTIILEGKKGKAEGLSKKCTAISHSIITATRPRSFMSPLQTGLAVYLFRKTGSKNIVDAVSNLGFCASYRDVTLFEASAVLSWDPVIQEGAFSQFSFDNADFNVRTMTGKGTFHSMGGIRCFTPHTAILDREIPKLTIVPVASELACARKIVMQTFQKQNEGGLANEPLREVYHEEDFQNAIQLSNHDMSWLLGIFFGLPSFPAWQGFMATITSFLPYEKSRVLALPFVNHPPSYYSTILTVLNYAVEETKKSGQSTCIVTFDQPLYIKAKDIVSQNSGSGGSLSNVVVRLGGFHLLMSFLGSVGFIMADSGLAELWSTVYASASVPHMLSGHAYARAIRAHCITFSALSMIILEEVDIQQESREYISAMLIGMENTMTYQNLLEDVTIEQLKMQFVEATKSLREKGKTAKLWLQYLELVTIMIHFIQSERTGDWNLHLSCIKAMLPIFHATGHFSYAKSCQLYLQDMESLHEKMPEEEYRKFTKQSFFTVRRSEKHWSGVWSDMTIEQTLMRGIKTLGGLTHGRGFSESVLNKWILGLPATHHVCEAVENYCDITSSTIDQHVEMRDARIQTDEQDRRKFGQWLREHSPFIDTNNLVSLATGYVTGDETNCYEAKRVGEEILQKSVSEASLFGARKLKRANTERPWLRQLAE